MNTQAGRQEPSLEPLLELLGGNVETYLGSAPIPPCTFGNFAEVLGMAFKYWITQQTKHRVFNWYIKMVRYVVGKEYEILRVAGSGKASIEPSIEPSIESSIGPESGRNTD